MNSRNVQALPPRRSRVVVLQRRLESTMLLCGTKQVFILLFEMVFLMLLESRRAMGPRDTPCYVIYCKVFTMYSAGRHDTLIYLWLCFFVLCNHLPNKGCHTDKPIAIVICRLVSSDSLCILKLQAAVRMSMYCVHPSEQDDSKTMSPPSNVYQTVCSFPYLDSYKERLSKGPLIKNPTHSKLVSKTLEQAWSCMTSWGAWFWKF